MILMEADIVEKAFVDTLVYNTSKRREKGLDSKFHWMKNIKRTFVRINLIGHCHIDFSSFFFFDEIKFAGAGNGIVYSASFILASRYCLIQ